MKDIIAALEAKRAAARAGGGEKHCRRHARDRGGFSLRTYGFVLAMAFALMAPMARAEGVGRWTDPGGVFSLDIAVSGWAIADRAANPAWFDDDYLILLVSNIGADGPRDVCNAVLSHHQAAPNALSRERMNTITRGMLASPTVAQMREDPFFRMERAEVVEIDGVAVLDIYGEFRTLETIQRRFFIHRNGRLEMYALACAVEAADAAAVAQSRAIAASLRFAAR